METSVDLLGLQSEAGTHCETDLVRKLVSVALRVAEVGLVPGDDVMNLFWS
jgi:hypothetical protein